MKEVHLHVIGIVLLSTGLLLGLRCCPLFTLTVVVAGSGFLLYTYRRYITRRTHLASRVGASGVSVTPLSPQSAWYDGSFYDKFVENQLSNLHAYMILKGGLAKDSCSRVLDAGCATGGFMLRLASMGVGCKEIVGVDLSPANIAVAQHKIDEWQKKQSQTSAALNLELCDLVSLPHHKTGTFDAVVGCMVLHEMPTGRRVPVLQEMARVAKRLVLCDFSGQGKHWWSFAGLRNRFMEVTAGPDHYSGFSEFLSHGGLEGYVTRAGLTLSWIRHVDSGCITVLEAHAH